MKSKTSKSEGENGSGILPEVSEQVIGKIASQAYEKYDDPRIGRDPREVCSLHDEGEEGSLLTPEEIFLFEGYTAEEIRNAEAELRDFPDRLGPGALNRPQLVLSKIPEILAEAIPPAYLACANYIGTWLVDHRWLRGVRSFSGVGDAMGNRGLNLVYVLVDFRRYYSLPSAFMSAEEKAAHQVALSLARARVLRRLIIG